MLSQILSLARGVVDTTRDRLDGWVNQMTGFGTSRDKTTQARFFAGCVLTDYDLSSLWAYDGLAGRIVDVWPREEMRLGFGIKGLSSECVSDVDRYLKPFDLVGNVTDARIWGRLYGGSAIWPMLDDGLDPVEPIDLERIRTVLGIRVIDRRWLTPADYYDDGPKLGKVSIWRVTQPTAGGKGQVIGYIHETRLVTFPGARTDALEKIRLLSWDQSVLLKPYAALRAAGQVWAAIDALIADANQAVMSVDGLYEMIATDPDTVEPNAANPTGGSLLLKRAGLMDQMRSAGRMIVLDKDRETFERKMTSFAGLPELSEAQWTRVSADAEIPVAILTGQSPAGLNATGDTTFQRFFAVADSNRVQIDEPRILQVLRILLSAQDAPELIAESAQNTSTTGKKTTADPIDDIGIVWLPLWAPTAAELSKIRLERAQEAKIWVVDIQGLLPEEAILSVPKEWWTFDREMREQVLEDDAENLVKQRAEQQLAPPPAPIAPGAIDPKPNATDPKAPAIKLAEAE